MIYSETSLIYKSTTILLPLGAHPPNWWLPELGLVWLRLCWYPRSPLFQFQAATVSTWRLLEQVGGINDRAAVSGNVATSFIACRIRLGASSSCLWDSMAWIWAASVSCWLAKGTNFRRNCLFLRDTWLEPTILTKNASYGRDWTIIPDFDQRLGVGPAWSWT